LFLLGGKPNFCPESLPHLGWAGTKFWPGALMDCRGNVGIYDVVCECLGVKLKTKQLTNEMITP
jgi:hypothetical protein